SPVIGIFPCLVARLRCREQTSNRVDVSGASNARGQRFRDGGAHVEEMRVRNGASESSDQGLFVRRDEHLWKGRGLGGACEQHRERAPRVGIEVFEWFVDPEEAEPRRCAQDENAENKLRDHLLAVTELFVAEILSTDAAPQRAVTLQT